MHSQWDSLEQLEELQLTKLKNLVHQAFVHVPFYRRFLDATNIKPEDFTSLDRLALLPTIDKNTLRTCYDDLKADNARAYHPTTRYTSGSTGIPQKFLLDRKNMRFEQAAIWRHFDWAGYHYRERIAIMRGKLVPGPQCWHLSNEFTLLLSSFKLNRENLDDYLDSLRRFQPTLIRAYPSAIYFLARLLEQRGVDDIRPRSIITASETLLPHQRACIERVFGCAIFDWYGSGEHVAIISQCPAGKYHIHMEYGIVEFVQRPEFSHGDELAFEIVCTGLNNYSMPLLRYQIGDIVRIRKGESCGCGRAFPVVSAIEGRLDDVIITPDGRIIPASGMTLAFEFSDNIAQAQLYQEKMEELVIRIVKTERYSESDHQFMLDQVRSRLGDAIRIRVDFVEEIQRLPSGKQPFSVSKVEPHQVF
jgi:phenylacetate-CoA ligase